MQLDPYRSPSAVRAPTSPRRSKDNRALFADAEIGMGDAAYREVNPRLLLAVQSVALAALQTEAQERV